MEEDSLRFWIIPIICFVVVMGIFVVILEYNFNTKMPNAEIELAEMQTMTCPEIEAKLEINQFWSMENGAFAREKGQGCADAAAAIRKAEKEKLDKLLADPNSLESLTRDLEKFQKEYDAFKKDYEIHSSQAAILKQNVTDFENKINEIQLKLQEKYGINQ